LSNPLLLITLSSTQVLDRERSELITLCTRGCWWCRPTQYLYFVCVCVRLCVWNVFCPTLWSGRFGRSSTIVVRCASLGLEFGKESRPNGTCARAFKHAYSTYDSLYLSLRHE
jgi:hypothetical protein